MSKNRKVNFKGKQVLLLGLVALVITAGYYRWTVETKTLESIPVAGDTLPANSEQGDSAEETDGQQSESSKGIAQLKQERDRGRGESIEQWKKTIEAKETSQEMRTEAEKKIKAANEWTEKEKTVETLVKAKGYSDCFAHINENGISVIVSGGEVNGAKIAQIKDVIVNETDTPVRNIKISTESF